MIRFGYVNTRNLRHIRQSSKFEVFSNKSVSNDAKKKEILWEMHKLLESNPKSINFIHKSISVESFQQLDNVIKQETLLHQISHRPSNSALRLVFINSAIPFVGFGFIDNVIMILAGDLIDVKLGVTIGISTLAAAGLGNLISDICGVGLGGLVEATATKLGLPAPRLSRKQEEMRITKFAEHSGAAIGIAIGCILGMVPLLFIDTNESYRLRSQNDVMQMIENVAPVVEVLPPRTSEANLESLTKS